VTWHTRIHVGIISNKLPLITTCRVPPLQQLRPYAMVALVVSRSLFRETLPLPSTLAVILLIAAELRSVATCTLPVGDKRQRWHASFSSFGDTGHFALHCFRLPSTDRRTIHCCSASRLAGWHTLVSNKHCLLLRLGRHSAVEHRTPGKTDTQSAAAPSSTSDHAQADTRPSDLASSAATERYHATGSTPPATATTHRRTLLLISIIGLYMEPWVQPRGIHSTSKS
jgi:hypothetical protein